MDDEMEQFNKELQSVRAKLSKMDLTGSERVRGILHDMAVICRLYVEGSSGKRNRGEALIDVNRQLESLKDEVDALEKDLQPVRDVVEYVGDEPAEKQEEPEEGKKDD